MKILRLVLLAMVAVSPGSLFGQLPSPTTAPVEIPNVRELTDLPYVNGGTPKQLLDLYLPKTKGAPRPLLVWIHGGAWKAGSKSQCQARRLVPHGYAVASVEYRFSTEAAYPAQIEDCKAAIRWLRAHAEEYGIDPKRIGVWGSSAGGHLVALLGVTGQDREFDKGENLDQSSAVRCVVDFFGPTDFLHYGDPPKPLDDPASAPAMLIGGPVSTHQAEAQRASPIYFVTKDAAPFLIAHGDQDPLVPLQQSTTLDAALKKAGVESTLRVVPGNGHGGPGFTSPEMIQAVVEFLDKHLTP